MFLKLAFGLLAWIGVKTGFGATVKNGSVSFREADFYRRIGS